MGAAASVASAATIFGAGVWVGANYSAAADVVNEALDSVAEAAEAVMSFLRPVASSALEKVKEGAAFVMDGLVKPVCKAAAAAVDDLRRLASSAFEKLKAAAAFVREKVIKLVRRLRGRKQAAAARRAVDRADAAGDDIDVLSRASASVAGFARQLQDVKLKALPPPTSSSAIVSAATAPGGELACCLVGGMAAHAAGRAAEMMVLLEAVSAVLGDNIPEDARSCIFVIVAAVGIGLETIGAAAANEA